MTVARNAAAAVRLADGSVLVAGGWNTPGAVPGTVIPLTTAEIYDPATASFHVTGSLNTPRSAALAEPLPNGQALVIGGETPAGAGGEGYVASTTEIYDPGTGRFTPGPNLPTALADPLALTLTDGRIWITGEDAACTGFGCPSPVFLYDAATNAFTSQGGLLMSRIWAAAVRLANGKVLVTSGLPDSPATSPLDSAEIYDPASGVSSLSAGFVQAATQSSAVLLPDGRVLICGGIGHFGPLAQCQLYDPNADTFTAAASMQQPRRRPVGMLLPDGSVLEASTEADPNAEEFHPLLGSFSNLGNFTLAHTEYSAVQLADGSILFAGGGTAAAEVFAPGSGAAPEFTLTTPHLEVVTGVTSATIPITVTGSGGFHADVTLSCKNNTSVACAFSPSSVASGQSSTLTVTGLSLTQRVATFTVVGTSGTIVNQLQLEVDLEPPVAALTPLELSFAPQAVGTASPPQTVHLDNEGGTALHIFAIAASGDFSVSSDCPAVIANGTTGCELQVVFRPGATGSRLGSVMVSDDSPQPPSPQTVALSGTGSPASAPALQLSPDRLDFGATRVGDASRPQTVALLNTGSTTLRRLVLSVSGDFRERDTCPSHLAAGARCLIEVTFRPRVAAHLAGLLLVRADAAPQPITVSLAGSGQPRRGR